MRRVGLRAVITQRERQDNQQSSTQKSQWLLTKRGRGMGVTLVQRGASQQGFPHTLCNCHVQMSRQECGGCHLCLHSHITEWGWSMGNLPQSSRRQPKVAGGESWLLEKGRYIQKGFMSQVLM